MIELENDLIFRKQLKCENDVIFAFENDVREIKNFGMNHSHDL